MKSTLTKLLVCFLFIFITTSGAVFATNFYPNKSITDLSVPANWNTDVSGNGAGTPCTAFNTAGQVFYIIDSAGLNTLNYVLNSPLNVSGTGSYIVIGDGINAVNFTTNGQTLTGPIKQVNANANFTVDNAATVTAITSTFSTVACSPTSTVDYKNIGVVTNIPIVGAFGYGNIIFDGTMFENAGTNLFTIQGNVTLQNTVANANSGFFPGGTGQAKTSMRFRGSGTHTITGNNEPLWVYNFGDTDVSVTLAASTPFHIFNSLNYKETTGLFNDGGDTLYCFNNVNMDGLAAGYNLSGTIVIKGTSGGLKIQNNNTTDNPIVPTLNNVDIECTGTGAPVFETTGGGTINIAGNFTNHNTGSANVTLGVASTTYTVNIGGNYNNTSTKNFSNSGTGTLIFNGNNAQTFTSNVTGGETIGSNLAINNNSATGVTLNSPVVLSGTVTLTLTKGLLNTSLTNTFRLTAGATCPGGGSALSYINGPMLKSYNAAASFTFPIGASGRYAPISFNSSSGTPVVTALYTYTPCPTNSQTLNSPLTNVSTGEYWNLSSSVAAISGNVVLGWQNGTASGIGTGISTYNNTLVVATDNGTSWSSNASSAPTGTYPGAGTVATSSAITLPTTAVPAASNEFSFGSTNATSNPLLTPSTPTVTTTPATCGNNNGTATVSVSGGATPYTYSWSAPGGSNATLSNLSGGNYTVTVTDANNCSVTALASISSPSGVVASISGTTNIACNGGSTGSATALATGGTGPFTYSWSSPGGTNALLSNLSAGTYTITITDANTCSSSAIATITQAGAIRDSILASGQKVVIHYWDFNNTLPVGGGGGDSLGTSTFPMPAQYSLLSTLNPKIVYSHPSAIQTTPLVCTLVDGFMDNGTQGSVVNDLHLNGNDTGSIASGNLYVRSRNPTENSYMYLYLPTTGFSNISLDFALSASSTKGPWLNIYSYSTNGGSTWNKLTSPMDTFNIAGVHRADTLQAINSITGVSGWDHKHIDFSSDPSVNNNPNFILRWEFEGTSCNATSGNDRYDNISLSGNSMNEVCSGDNSVNASVGVSGGTAPYTYSWSPVVNSGSSVSNLSAGTYTVNVTDANNCSATAALLTITQPTLIHDSISSFTNISCSVTTGTATLGVKGGTSPYTYTWSNGKSTSTVTGLTAGTYTVSLKDLHGCIGATASVTISNPPSIGVTTTPVPATCGNNNGSATANVTGGTSPFTYSWSAPGGSNSSISNLSVGTYTITVTDASSCTATATAIITNASGVSASIAGTTPTSCNGGSTGSATALATGGTSPYTYSWSAPGGSNALLSNLSAGTYTVTITDANNCNSQAIATITQAAGIRDSIASAIGSNVVIHYWDFNNTPPSGGGGGDSLGTSTFPLPAQYSLLSSLNPKIVYSRPSALQTTPLVCTLIDGFLDNGSQGSVVNDLHLNGNDTGSIASGNLYVRSRNPTENSYMYLYLPTTGFSNISLDFAISASSTKGPWLNIYSYSTNGGTTWNKLTSPMDTFNIGGVHRADTLQAVNPITAGSLWDPKHIDFSSDPSVNNNPNFILRWQFEGTSCNATSGNDRYDNISVSGNAMNALCNGSGPVTVTVGVKGSATPFTYTWSPNVSTTATASNLTANTYSVTVADANGCTATTSITITQPTLLTATISASTNVSCNAGSNGTATVTAGGGSSPYTYSWSVSGKTTSSITGLSAGTYTVTVTDVHLCSATTTVTISQPSALGVTTGTTGATCGNSNGSATANVTNGTSPYTYSWAPGAQTGSTASALSAGTYTVYITDHNTCTATATAIVNNSNGVVASISSVTGALCNGNSNGSATALGTGGTTPYTYSWSAPGGSNALLSNLSAGTYTVYITDANNCSDNATAIVTQPAAITSVLIPSTPSVVLHYWDFNNTIPAAGGGGDSLGTVFSYANSASVDLSDKTQTLYAPYTIIGGARIEYHRPSAVQTTPLVCLKRDSIIDNGTKGAAVDNLNSSNALIAAALGNDTSSNPNDNLYIRSRNPSENSYMYVYIPTTGYGNIAFDFAVSASSTSGTWLNIYSYSTNGGSTWNNLTSAMDTFNISGVHRADTLQVINTITASSLWEARHIDFSSDPNVNNNPNFILRWQFAGTQSNGSSGNDRYDNFSITGNSLAETCFGDQTVSLTASVNGGTAPFTYSWSPNVSTTSTASNLSVGTYSVSIKDANGCSSSTAVVTVTQPTMLRDSIASSQSINCNFATGSATPGVKGGTSPYTYSWTTGDTTRVETGLSAGTYTLTVTDLHGCTATASVIINSTPSLAISSFVANATSGCGNTGSVTVTETGGTSPYTYSWSNGSTSTSSALTATLSGLSANTYSVVVLDSNGCTASSGTVTVTSTSSVTVTTFTATPSSACANTGSVTVTTTGGSSPFTYSWSNGTTSSSSGATTTLSNLSAGTYSVVIIDVNGCSGSSGSVTVTAPTALSASISSTTPVTCVGNNGSATALASNGTSPYTYSWSAPGGSNSTLSGLSAGTYTVYITDAASCTSSTIATITQAAGVRDSVVSVTGNKVTIHYWDFNNTLPANGAGGDSLGTVTFPLPAQYSLLSALNPKIIYSHPSAVQTTPLVCTSVDGILDNLTPGSFWDDLPLNGNDSASSSAGNLAVRSRNPSENAYMYLYLPTTGYSNITFDYAISASSSKGAFLNIYSYSTNGGTTWNKLTSPMDTFNIGGVHRADTLQIINPTTAASLWDHKHIDFSSDPTVNNNPNFILRWEYEGNQSNGSSGNDRYDNFVISGNSMNETCNGDNDVTVTIGASGSATPFTYSWSPSVSTSSSASGLSAGNYSVTVEDANSCSGSMNVITITQPALLTATITASTNVSCNGGSTGTATVTAGGGTSPYTYKWSPGGKSTSSVTGLSAGTYTVTVSDLHLCSATATVTITQPTSAVGVTTSVVGASCGNSNGSATANVTGGTSPYTYSWAPGVQTGSTASALSAGTFTVYVSDGGGCTATATAIITNSSGVNASISATTGVDCNGNSTGSATASASGGTSPYTYSWAPSGGSNSTASGLSAGTYTVTITDNTGCHSQATAIITQPTALTSIITPSTPSVILHYWDFNQTIPAGGGGKDSLGTTYSYANSFTVDTTHKTGTLYAPYTVVSGGARMIYVRPTGIQTTPLVSTLRDSIVDNGSQGSVINDLNRTNASIAAALGNDTTSLAADNLFIRSRNPDENSYMYMYMPTTGYGNIKLDYVISASSVKGAMWNVFSYSTNGGTTWNQMTSAMDTFNTGGRYHPDTLQMINPTTSSSNWYPVHVDFSSDANINNNANFVVRWQYEGAGSNGSSGNDRYDNFSVSGNSLAESCNGNSNVILSAAPSGGTSPFTYSWSPVVSTNSTVSNLSAGTYSVTVKDANGCTSSSSITVTAPPALRDSIASSTNITCTAVTGSATVGATGGTNPYTYSWSAPGGSNALITGLSAGTYTVTVSDVHGCSVSASVTITTAPSLTISTFTATASSSCSNTGSVTVTTGSGTSPFTYSWSNGTTTTGAGPSATLSALAVGTYSVTVKDSNGCSATSTTVNVTAPLPLTMVSLTASGTSACANTGSVTVTTGGGTSPFTYSWSTGTTTTGTGPSATLSGLSGGTYSVTVLDANGCSVTSTTATVSGTGTFSVTTFTATAASACSNNGSVSVTTTGGSSPFTYMWSTGSTTTSASATATLSGLSGGTYSVVVSDINGCSASSSTITVTQPVSIRSSIYSTPTTCRLGSDGSVQVYPSGGVNPYTYSWSTGTTTNIISTNRTVSGLSAGTYSVSITDANGCNATNSVVVGQPLPFAALGKILENVACLGSKTGAVQIIAAGGKGPYTYSWSNGSGLYSMGNLSAGTYTCTATDHCGFTATVSLVITQPATALTQVISFRSVTCNGNADGIASTLASGGLSPYSYLWLTGATTTSVTGLSAGAYNVKVSDANGCSITKAFVITQPAAVAPYVLLQRCVAVNNGTVELNTTGGTRPYTYSWSSGSTNQDLSGLSNGSYTVTVTDNNHCSGTLLVTVSCTSGPDMGDAPKPGTKDCCPMNEINVYPNPNNGQFTISGLDKGMMIEVYDYLGKEITKFTASDISMQVNLFNQANGVYLIRILNTDGTLVDQKKVVKTY